ncbi:virulence protein [Parabacteroides sp. PF5-6]|uniref:virulence protein n=1 Tax=Parabacteroides sp. PF5-6 TaxID=1742403 RepID=UPI002404E290|nr:virulence protein [Parabacteroides sp. PF5-6]MDF9831043.1 virulence-associated protein VapD [Parabacteroides sp. PF5-6]
MYAIAFDMAVADLKVHYGEPYNNAYFEIGKILRKYEFYNIQGSVYVSQNRDMSNLFDAINTLKEIEWFVSSVRDIRAFRMEDWSDFTLSVKRKQK